MTASFPSFADFYEDVHRRPPFPWQVRLADLVAATGWPTEIGVPTGLGKTSVIDVAVWSLAAQADRDPAERTAPTRIWYVVNRRLLVDAGHAHALELSGLLASAESGPLGSVAEALVRIGASRVDAGPLPLISLRGGIPTSRPPDPSVPTVIASTVPMFGSRLLFRGYGASRSMAPVDAAMAGVDAVVLLDEAHISEPLQRLLAVMPEADANHGGVLRAPGQAVWTDGPESLLPAARSRPTLVSLTATGSDERRFELDPDDFSHPVVAQRLSAAKPTTLVSTTTKRLARTLAERVLELLNEDDRRRCAVVFVNSPRTALDVVAALGEFDGEVITLTGRLREPDADQVRRRLLDPVEGVKSGREGQPAEKTVVVATQTLEVGADLDFDALVTASAGVKALTQRFGRLNRLGTRPWAAGVVAHPADAKPGHLYGDEPEHVADRLASFPDPFDLGPAAIGEILGPSGTEPPVCPELLGAHLWEYAKTWTPPPGEAPVEVFFAGLEDPYASVSVAWRVDPEEGRLWVVPTEAETVEIPIGEAKEALADETLLVVSREDAALERRTADEINPGDVLVIDARLGGYGAHGWQPESNEPVLDLSPLLARSLALTIAQLTNLLGRDLDDSERAVVESSGLGVDEEPDREADHGLALAAWSWLEALPRPDHVPAGLWRFDLGQDPRLDRRGPNLEPWLVWDEPRPRVAPQVESYEELSNVDPVSLSGHNDAVGERASAIAAHLGLPSGIVAAVGAAGRFHDLGKADPRFQKWLGHEVGQDLLAKGRFPRGSWERRRVAAQWPKGGRHELLSVKAVQAAVERGVECEEFELVCHLVAAHHGRGRPLPDVVDAPPMGAVVLIDGVEVDFTCDLSLQDWDQPQRFRDLSERFGHWGLALLEAIVRQADHVESQLSEVF